MEKEKRNLIIKAAVKRFIRHGRSKTTLDEIARDLRMSKSSLYHYFDSKDDLFNQSLNYEFDCYLKEVIEIFNSDRELKDKLFSYFDLKQEIFNKYRLVFDLIVLYLNRQVNDFENVLISKIFSEEEQILKKFLKKSISKNETGLNSLSQFLLFQSWGLIISHNLQQINNPGETHEFKNIFLNQFDHILK